MHAKLKIIWTGICCLLLFSSSILADVTVRSCWIPGPTTPPVIDGVVTAGEWQDAGSVPILVGTSPAGYILVRNDLENLYMILDVTSDNGNDAVPMEDSFRLTVDVKADKTIEPNVDLQFAMLPFSTNLGKQFYLGPGSYTALTPVTDSQLGVGFSGSPILTSPSHRMWEMAINLAEIGIGPDIWTSGGTAIVRVGVRLISTNPSFSVAVPGAFETDFNELITIYLGYPSIAVDPSAPGLKGVGHIPRSNIVDGYADTWSEPDPILQVKDSPFGGKIDIKGDFAALKVNGAVKYRLYYSKDGAPDLLLTQNWTNYEWDGVQGKYIARAIKPDADGKYECLPDPLNDWYWNDLAMRWQTSGYGNGEYTIKLYAYGIADAPIPPGGGVYPGGTLTLRIDNTPPQVEIKDVYHYTGGTMNTLTTCGIVPISAAPNDGLRFRIKAIEDDGHLWRYCMTAYYGNNQHKSIIPEEIYTSGHINEDGIHLWDGESDLVYPAPGDLPWKPDMALSGVCGYQFRLWARSRAITGYTHIFYREYNRHACIETP